MKARTLSICMATLMATAGCASSGSPFTRQHPETGSRFTRPQAETLVLGKTTYDEVVRQVGEPVRTGTGVKNDQPLKVVGYRYYCGLACKLREERDWTGKFYSRAMSFFFSDDVLVGYDYTSTHDTDDTDFDDTKAYQLKKGQTTRSQVIELLGKPSGMYIYPMISSKTDTALVYVYQDTKLKRRFSVRWQEVRWLEMKHTSKFLVVSFDTQDLLTGAEFGPGGER